MANSAFDHSPTIVVPGSSTNTALVKWGGTGADTFTDSTILVGATTMGLAADTDLLTFSNGTLTIGGTLAANTVTASGVVTFGSLSDGTIAVTAWVDEDNMASNSATLIPTQQSVKAYVDAAGGSQTPWTGNIDGANYTLSNVGDAGNDWTANTLVLQHDAAGAQMQFKMYNTSSSAGSSAAFKTRSMSGTGDPIIEFEVTSGGQFLMGVDNSNGDLCVLGGHGQGLGGNDTFRVTQGTPPVLSLNTGLGSNFDYVCSNCGNHGLEMFTCCGEVEWHDDVLALRKAGVDLATMANPYAIGQSLNIAHLVKLGVMNYDDKEEDLEALANRKTPWLGINISNGLMFTWAGMWQTRERMDNQYQELKDTIQELKAEVDALKG
jgi:hypothetical protein